MTERVGRKKEQIGGTEGRGRQEDQKGGHLPLPGKQQRTGTPPA